MTTTTLTDTQLDHASAPLKSLLMEYGFTVDKVIAAAKAQLAPTSEASQR